MMLERAYYTTIAQGFQDIRDRPQLLEHFFLSMGLAREEVRSIRNWFISAEPSVNHAFPRHGASKFPGVFIVLESEDERQKVLDDFGGLVSFDDAIAENYPELGGAEIRTSFYEYRFNLFIVADNPDKCLYLFQLVRYILTAQHKELQKFGVLVSNITGSDLAPNPEYLPETFFIRRMIVKITAQAPVYEPPPRFGLDGTSDSGAVTNLTFRPIRGLSVRIIGRDCDS
jgi:hypothetical protein